MRKKTRKERMQFGEEMASDGRSKMVSKAEGFERANKLLKYAGFEAEKAYKEKAKFQEEDIKTNYSLKEAKERANELTRELIFETDGKLLQYAIEATEDESPLVYSMESAIRRAEELMQDEVLSDELASEKEYTESPIYTDKDATQYAAELSEDVNLFERDVEAHLALNPQVEKQCVPQKPVVANVITAKEVAGEQDFQVEESVYKKALKIMENEKFCFLDNPDMSPSLSHFTSNYWGVLSEEQLKSIVYQWTSESDKISNANIDAYCKNVARFIKYEARNKYFGGEGFTEEDFQAINNHTVLQNCVYDIQAGKTRPFNMELPYYYAIDANYIDSEEDTPYYNKLKEDATGGDEDSMEMIDLMIAYLLIPNRSAKCFFVMASARDSGKSLLGQFISRLLEMRTKCINPEHMSDRFSYSDADRAVLFSCLEMNTDRLKSGAVTEIKKITGEVYTSQQDKHINSKTIRIRFKLLMATNGGIMLPLGMEDSAFYRRLIVIPFVKSTPLDSLINDLDKKLWNERDAIVSKCVRKLGKYIDKDGGIVFPESALSLTIKEKWIGGRCLDEEFVTLAFGYTGDSDDRIAIFDIDEVYHFYVDLHKQSGADVIIADRKTLIAKIMAKYGGVERKKSRVARLKEPDRKKPFDALCRLKWNSEFIQEIGFI